MTRPAARWCLVVLMLVGIVVGGLMSACASTPRSTQPTLGDFEEMSAEMGARLAESAFLEDRGPQTPSITVAVDRVENLMQRTMLPTDDLWSIMNRVVESSDIKSLGRLKNISFVIQAEHLREGLRRGQFEPGYAAGRNPTHQMSAVFRSVPRSDGRARADAYLCEFRILALSDGALVWSDQFVFKREAFGKVYD